VLQDSGAVHVVRSFPLEQLLCRSGALLLLKRLASRSISAYRTERRSVLREALYRSARSAKIPGVE
jgi:hypothetical protein